MLLLEQMIEFFSTSQFRDLNQAPLAHDRGGPATPAPLPLAEGPACWAPTVNARKGPSTLWDLMC